MRLWARHREVMLRIVVTHILVICFVGAVMVCGFCFEADSGWRLSGAGERLERLEIYFETEMYAEASALLDELMVEYPDESRFEYLQAIVDYQRGSYNKASKIFEEFIQDYPEVAEPYYLLGEINLKKGNIAGARRYFREYCGLVPQDLQAQRKLNSLSNDTGEVGLQEATIIKDGEENSSLVKKIGFYGACVHSRQVQSIKLINGMQGSWASMGIDLARPLDLRAKQVVLELKGKQGGEKFVLIFRDKFAQDYTPQLVLEPEEEVSPEWRQLRVPLEAHQAEIDLSCVVHIGLEFGFSTVQNPVHSTLFVRDIIIK